MMKNDKLIEQVDYKGDIPEFKGKTVMQTTLDIDEYNYSNRFVTLYDFTDSLNRGGEIEFDWNGKSYGIGHDEKGIVLYEANNSESEKFFETADDVLDAVFAGQRLREIIKDIDVTMRTI